MRLVTPTFLVPALLAGVVMTGMAALPSQGATAAMRVPAPAAASAPTCAADAPTLSASPRAKYVWHRLRTDGYSAPAAAGIIATLDSWSTLSPVAVSNDGLRKGLAQWGKVRWAAYANGLSGANRWSLARQVTHLIGEMTAGYNGFAAARVKNTGRVALAALAFDAAFAASPGDPATLRKPLTSKGAGWLARLSPVTVKASPSDNGTYGIVVDCTPPNSSLDVCPPITAAFKESFANHTGFTWSEMSANAKRVSRCVYANFPRITLHGTYNGHMPTWSQAIDFMMPAGCTTTSTQSYTNSKADLALGTRLTRYLIDRYEPLDVDYVIWQDRLRNPVERGENTWLPIANWRQDNYNNGNCTNTHFDHIHMSVNSEVVAAWVAQRAKEHLPEHLLVAGTVHHD